MSALDSIEDFKFRVRKYPEDDPRRRYGHELHIEITTSGRAKISSRTLISSDIPPEVSAVDYLIQKAARQLKAYMADERDGSGPDA